MGEEFILHPHKLMFHAATSTLICSDLHIGKSEHFRRNGIQLPHLMHKNNFWKLSGAFDLFRPNTFLVLGDMVHSTENTEWNEFWDFLDNYPALKRILVRGNHELYENAMYENHGFAVHDSFALGDILCTHEPLSEPSASRYNLCGHIHPAIRLSGAAGQHMRLPCFWFGAEQGVLPAFGEFTGMKTIRAKKGDKIFVVSKSEVIEMKE